MYKKYIACLLTLLLSVGIKAINIKELVTSAKMHFPISFTYTRNPNSIIIPDCKITLHVNPKVVQGYCGALFCAASTTAVFCSLKKLLYTPDEFSRLSQRKKVFLHGVALASGTIANVALNNKFNLGNAFTVGHVLGALPFYWFLTN